LDLDIAIMQLAYQQQYSDRMREESQMQLRQSERLASIGQMVTGLAHESRNLLQRSHACLETLILDIEDRPEALKLAHRIEAALDHLHVLYEEVRNFAAPIVLELEQVDLARALMTAWQHLESYGEGHSVKIHAGDFASGIWTVRGDRSRIDQIFTNVLQNAVDACRAANSDSITCAFRRLESDNGVEVVIEDTGCGISLESHKALEPFVTTKPKGTGLGLAITKRILDAHGGSIRLENAPTRGARVTITLPTDPNVRTDPAAI
jgi:signal transduction histidine kinase